VGVLVIGTINMIFFDDIAGGIAEDYYRAKSIAAINEASKAESAGESLPATIDDILEGAQKKPKTKGRAQQREKSGGYGQALDDYDKLRPDNSKDIQTKYGPGKTGTLPDGSKVNVRPGSSYDAPTLEIQRPNNKQIKIRYVF